MAKTKFRPLHDRVVVRRIEADEKTKAASSFRIPSRRSLGRGEIIAVGPGGRDENGKLTPMGVKAGDRVLFGKWSGTEVKLEKRPRAASSSPTPPRRSPKKARSSPSALAAATRAGKLIPIDVKSGDRVLFGKWSGTEVKLDGEELLIMKESDIMGVIA